VDALARGPSWRFTQCLAMDRTPDIPIEGEHFTPEQWLTSDNDAEAVLSRTNAVLARVTPKVWVPMSGMKVRSLVVLSNHSASKAYRGGTIPWAPNHYGGAKSLRGRRKVPTMSEVLSSIQCIYFRNTSGSNMGVKLVCYQWGAEVW